MYEKNSYSVRKLLGKRPHLQFKQYLVAILRNPVVNFTGKTLLAVSAVEHFQKVYYSHSHECTVEE